MKDKRVAYQRDVLEALLESLDAALRLARWPEQEPAPAALKAAAAELNQRLGVANRFAKDQVSGAPAARKVMVGIAKAIQLLDGAYVEYRRTLSGTPAEQGEAADRLEASIVRVRRDSGVWSGAQ